MRRALIAAAATAAALGFAGPAAAQTEPCPATAEACVDLAAHYATYYPGYAQRQADWVADYAAREVDCTAGDCPDHLSFVEDPEWRAKYETCELVWGWDRQDCRRFWYGNH